MLMCCQTWGCQSLGPFLYIWIWTGKTQLCTTDKKGGYWIYVLIACTFLTK